MSDLGINVAGLMPVRQAFNRLAALDVRQLLDVLGSEVESQTRRRIGEEKTDPDGKPWEEWSAEYAERRPARGGILELSGELRDSLTYEVGDDAVTVGSNLLYARRHNEGDEDHGIPERRYLGLSEENLSDLSDLTMEFIARRIQG